MLMNGGKNSVTGGKTPIGVKIRQNGFVWVMLLEGRMLRPQCGNRRLVRSDGIGEECFGVFFVFSIIEDWKNRRHERYFIIL